MNDRYSHRSRMSDALVLACPHDCALSDLAKALSVAQEASSDLATALYAASSGGSRDLANGITAHRLALALYIVLKVAPVPASVHERVPGGLTLKEILDLAVLEVGTA